MSNFRSTWITALAFGALAVLLTASTAPASAHARGWHHKHRHARAVIVVGKPRPVRVVASARTPRGVLDMNVKPKATEVWVDGTFRGTCDAFDGHPSKLVLPAGPHHLKLVTPDGETVARKIQVVANTEINVGLDLR